MLQPAAPVRPVIGCTGAFHILALLAAVLIAGCGEEAPPDARRLVLELADDTIVLPPGIALHEVRLRERDGQGVIEPATVEARAGDVLRFVASDARGYSVRFDVAALSAEAAGFLDATHQLASPPLLGEGAAWVVNLEGAPAGEYRYYSANHGVPGLVIVRQ